MPAIRSPPSASSSGGSPPKSALRSQLPSRLGSKFATQPSGPRKVQLLKDQPYRFFLSRSGLHPRCRRPWKPIVRIDDGKLRTLGILVPAP